MRPGRVAIVGAAETTELGEIPQLSALGLHADAALNALADCGLTPGDVDGVASLSLAPYMPTQLAHYLGIAPGWVDTTMTGGCSSLLQVRHAAAAIEAGHCHTVLVTHGESGRSHVGAPAPRPDPSSLMGQFELPFGTTGPTTLLSLPVVRYMREYGLREEELAMVAVVQREWAARNPRARFRDPVTLEEVLASKLIAWPFRRLMCCPVTDGGGALVLVAAERARDFPTRPVYLLGSGESVETPLVSQMEDPLHSRAYRMAGRRAFEEAGVGPADVDHAMLYDAMAHLPLFALEELGFVGPGEAGRFVWERRTAPGGELPVNTSGGGLSYTHTGMYGMFALLESVRQLRGTAPAQVPGVRISVTHGLGGMWNAAGTLVLGNERP